MDDSAPRTSQGSPTHRGPCRFWQKGACRYGNGCWFIHDQQLHEHLQQPQQQMHIPQIEPPVPYHHHGYPKHHVTRVITLPTRYVYQAQVQPVRYQPSLRVANPSTTSPASSRSICRYWLQGICNRGPACRFLHGAAAPAAHGMGPVLRGGAGGIVVTPSAPRSRPRAATFDVRYLPSARLASAPGPYAPPPHICTPPPQRFRTYTYPQPSHSDHLPALLTSPPPQPPSLLLADPPTLRQESLSPNEYQLPFNLDEWDDFEPDLATLRQQQPRRDLRSIWDDDTKVDDKNDDHHPLLLNSHSSSNNNNANNNSNGNNSSDKNNYTTQCQNVWNTTLLPDGLPDFEKLAL
ncbi:hypothetical protein DFJ77DRAFT_341003 [Powellomyces hirtus]|nr:hypothetical protein DFJ77DRAFT_341003 [Powellomyces hirtus]